MVTYQIGDEVLVPNKLSLLNTQLDENYRLLSDQLPGKAKCLLASNADLSVLQQTEVHGNCIVVKNHDKHVSVYLVCKIILWQK